MKLEKQSDEALCAEVVRRLREDGGSWRGLRSRLDVHLFDLGLEVAEIPPDPGPRRLWFYGKGQWSWSRWQLFGLGGDEYGNRPLLVRLPQGRVMLINWRVPLLRVLDDPEDFE